MCTGTELAILSAVVGGGTKAINQGVAAGRQDRATARGIREQGELQRGADVKVNELIESIAGNTGEAERGEALEGFLNTLRGSQELTGAEADPLGLGGGRFAERVGAGEAVTRAAGTERAGRLSVVDAAGRQRRGEAADIAGTAGALNEVQRQSQAKDFITRLRVASKRPNPIVDALASVVQGAGTALALGPGIGQIAGAGAKTGASAAGKAGQIFSKGKVVPGIF